MSFNLYQAVIFGLALLYSAVVAEPVVHVGKVTYHGLSANSTEHFHNIRYAHDTSGARRFAPPEPYTPPEGSLDVDAATPGSACPQSKAAIPLIFAEVPDISEDCLNLRISRPAGTSAGDKLPVVVHIYTGGLIRGNTEDPHWDPDNLITLSESAGKPIVYVALNFRHTIFGYANLPVLKDQKSLNVGMRDQRVGLQWVKDNIEAFGGDPDRITAFGLSAGGTMTSLHLVAYGGEDLPFTQAWAMSGPPGTALNIISDATEIHTRAVAEKLECHDSDGDDEDTLKCLRKVPMERLLDVAMEYSVNNHPPMGLFTFIPSVDGDILPDRQSVLYKSGKFAKGVPLVYGWTQDDGASNAGPADLFQDEQSMKSAIQDFAHLVTDEDYSKLFSAYSASEFEQEVADYEASKAELDPIVPVHWFRISWILRDILFTCSSIDFGYEMSKQSKALDGNFPGVRFYNLNQSMLSPIFKAMGMPYIGACHGSDYHYISNGVFPEGQVSDEDKALSRSMALSFIYFAYTGNPSIPNDTGFGMWPEAFIPEDQGEEPSRLNIQLIGGPLGSGPCTLGGKAKPLKQAGMGSMQISGGMDGLEFGEMESEEVDRRNRELGRQRLLERCALVNGLAEKFDI